MSDSMEPKGSKAGQTLTDLDKEIIRQTFALTQNKRETARRCQVSEKTVYNVLNETAPAELNKRRAESLMELAGKVHSSVDNMLDNVTQEKIDRCSLPQLMLAVGIGIDKIEKLQQQSRDLVQTTSGDPTLLPPSTIDGLLSGIKGSLKQLTFLGIKIETHAPELQQRMEAAVQDAEVLIKEGGLDFDNPSPSPRTE